MLCGNKYEVGACMGMKAMLKFSLLTCIALLLLLPTEISACSCREFTPCEAFNYSSAVFIGTVVGGTTKVREYNKEGKIYSIEAGEVRLIVEEAFKGITATEVTVTGFDAFCGPEGMLRGKRYLVYARQHNSSGLVIGSCSPTKRLDYDKEEIALYRKLGIDGEADLAFLRNLPKPGSGGRVYGHVGVDFGGKDNPALPGIKMVLNNSQQHYEAVTDDKGDYEILGVIPGKYQLEINLPENYTCHSPKREVAVDDRGCVNGGFWVQVDNRIKGRIVDLTGHPAPAKLTLLSLTKTGRKFLGFARNDGEFEIKGIEPGRYLLLLHIASAGQAIFSGQEELYFYPGTFDRGQATTIEVGRGEKLTDYTFTLPEKLKAHTIKGVVQYADGKPAVQAHVLLWVADKTTPNVYRTEDIGSTCYTDQQGRFELVGFAGNTYTLHADEDRLQANRENHPHLFSELMRFQIDQDMTELKLVLTTTKDPAPINPPKKTATPGSQQK